MLRNAPRRLRLRLDPLRRLARDEDGLGMVELVASLVVLAVGFFSLIGALGLGLREVGLARQRQSATEVVNARIEHLRNLSYQTVALSTAPVHNSDPENPDWSVSPSGTHYDYTGKSDCSTITATCEALIVDSAAGAVAHIEDPVTVGSTQMNVYQFTTWVDDPLIAGTQDYRRLTVVAQFKFPAITGAVRFVRASSLFTPGTVTVAGNELVSSQGSPSPTPSPSPQPTTSCSGDTSAPTGSFSIESTTGSETGYTASTGVSVRLSYTDSCTPITIRLSNDSFVYGDQFTYDPQNPTVGWSIPSGDGSKSVWAKIRDGAGNEVVQGPKTVVLDTTKPTVPGTLTKSISCSGDTRTVTLTWQAASDTNLSGYRLYRSVNTGPWEMLAQISGLSTNDSHRKILDSVRYYAVAFDKAGNESDHTNEVSLAKNQC